MSRAMKVSGVAWIGEIPQGWEVVRGKNMLIERNERSKHGNEELLSVSTYTGVKPRREIIDTEETLSRADSLIDYKICHQGDIVINTMLAWNGSIGLSNYAGIVSPAYGVYQIRKGFEPRFVEYLLRSEATLIEIRAESRGINDARLRLYPDSLFAIQFGTPSFAEQRDIADYLDRQTALIDRRLATLAEKKAALAELRKATIHEVVTKGLNKTAPMKDSGNLFIGNIPAHWVIRRLKELSTKIGSGKTPLGGSSVYVPEGVMFLRSQNVWDEGLFLDDVVYIAETMDKEMKGSRIKVGDILINVTGASIGRTCLVPDGVVSNVNQHVCIVRLRNKKFASFVARAMQAYATQRQIAEVQVGAAREGLNFEQIGNLFVVFPPPDEQHAIADHLDQKTQQFDAQLATLDEQARVLKELRKAIIHEAVTGKIDLSGYTPPTQ